MFSKNKLSVYFFIIAIIVALANPFPITNPNINDADASSYVIVPMLMLPLLAVFVFKERIVPKSKKKDVLIGIGIFAAFVLAIIALQLLFPYYFLSFRLDMIAFPLAIAAFAAILFGVKNVMRFKPLFIYALLASPLLFIPFLGLNNFFAQANTMFVYNVLHLFSSNIVYTAPFSIGTANYTIGIGTACAGIAVFIALVLFLIPIAYLFDGKDRGKVYWVACGFALLLLFNFLRMSSIAGIWLIYGPNATASFVHGFAGILLFYAAIIIMILLAKRFGLIFPKIRKGMVKKTKQQYLNYLIVMLLCISYFLLSLNYLSATIIPATSLVGGVGNTFTSQSLQNFGASFKGASNWNESIALNSSDGIIVLRNSTFASANPILVLLTYPNSTFGATLLKNNTVLSSYYFADVGGSGSSTYKIISNQTLFFVSVRDIEYPFSNSSFGPVIEYVIITGTAGYPNINCQSSYDPLYTYLANLMGNNDTQANVAQLTSAYCISSEFGG
ncbi:MAG: archaeosortase/exosortase family protein [Candidatus Micrarchaeales archaeon]